MLTLEEEDLNSLPKGRTQVQGGASDFSTGFLVCIVKILIDSF